MSFNLDGFSPAVPVVLTKEISKHQLLNFPAFNTWITTLKSSLARQTEAEHPFHNDPYTLRSITIQSVDYFSPTRIGFIKLSAVVRNGKNETLPGIVFLRGGSVAILMILRPSDSKTERWVIMAEQPRIPVGSLAFMEIPAGMLDNEGTFVGAAAKQIAEETGLEIKTRDLKDLTGLALKKAGALDGLRKCSRVAYLFVLCL
jgi:ADP-sugar diphosphatase